ncbi:MAG: energy-coupling factor transporter transmembrane protein EcfT [Lachnospiraceae bacterium]|nr:energy-coupling factor transporter transmembrane protein EcfT [Lachnospiraceae bacterium]
MNEQRKKKKLHLDPRTKLLIIIVVATMEMMKINIYMTIAVGSIPFILHLTNRNVKGALKYGILFTLAVLAHIYRTDMNINMVVNMIIVLLGGLVLTLFPAFTCGDYILQSTGASEVISALGKLRIGKQFTIPLSVIFRFFPTIGQEHSAIHDAALMRGLTIGRKKFWKDPAQAFEFRVVPLMISIANIGTDLSAAALSRGLDNPAKHTNYAEVRFTYKDAVAVAAMVLILGGTYVVTAVIL